MKKKILVVSFKVGAGHVQAAKAICEELEECDAYIKHVDLGNYATTISRNIYQKGYIQLIDKTPQLYSFFYKRVPPQSDKIRLLLDLFNTAKFKKLLVTFKPDIIISTHFIATSLLCYWKKKGVINAKIGFVMTDHEFHPLFFDEAVDLYTVPSEKVRQELIESGVKSEIKVTGIPVGKNFRVEIDQKKSRAELGLDEDKFTVLIMNGGFGQGARTKILSQVGELGLPLQIIIVAGQNTRLKNKLSSVADELDVPVKVFGFTKDIPLLMAASDIIVSKAGGLTVSESLVMDKPMIIFNPTPGQEVANTKFLLDNNAGFLARDMEDIGIFINFIYNHVINIEEVEKNIGKIKKPLAAKGIANEINSMIGSLDT